MRKFWMLLKTLNAFRSQQVRSSHQPVVMTVACCNPASSCGSSYTTTTITNNTSLKIISNDSASVGSFFLPSLKKPRLQLLKGYSMTEEEGKKKEQLAAEKRFFDLLVMNNNTEAKEKNHLFIAGEGRKNKGRTKKFLRHIGIFTFLLLMMNLFFIKNSIGQTATITFDYTGGTNSCSGESDNTYSGTSGTIVTVPATGIPANAIISGISFTSRYGVFIGSTTITYTLNGTSIGSLNGNSNTCLTGNISPISIPLFNKTGPNTLEVTIAGGFLPGVYNGVFTVNYTVPCPLISASATKTDITCFAANNGTITVSGSGSTATPYTFSIDNGSTYQSSNIFNNLPVGTYKIRVKDANGCESKAVQ